MNRVSTRAAGSGFPGSLQMETNTPGRCRACRCFFNMQVAVFVRVLLG